MLNSPEKRKQKHLVWIVAVIIALSLIGTVGAFKGWFDGGNLVPQDIVTLEKAFQCGDNVTFTYRGSQVTYGTVSSQGRCWMDRNLGAARVATTYNDPEAYGDLFQWGRLDDNHQDRSSGLTRTISSTDNPGHSNFIYGMGTDSPWDWRSPQNDNLWQGVAGTNNPCPPGWRIPTEVELETEHDSWSQQNYQGAFTSPLKLTAGGRRRDSYGSLHFVGSSGFYWSSTVSGNLTRKLFFGSRHWDAGMRNDFQASGFSVRCIKDGWFEGGNFVPHFVPQDIVCDDNVTFTYRGSQVTYGTVSSQGRCWMDRNLGAARVATTYNDPEAYGDLFQWGRLDDNHQDRSSGLTRTISSTDNPGHSNFIYGMGTDSPWDWRSPQNDNLWQGVAGTNNPCPIGWRLPTKTEWNIERLSWSSNDHHGAFVSPLKLTAGGGRSPSFKFPGIYNVGSSGLYWSSTVAGIGTRVLLFSSTGAGMRNNQRASGFSVRCIKD